MNINVEARIQGHYCFKYKQGESLAKTLIAEKPNDIHSLNSVKLGINRSDVKAVYYAVIYGAAAAKIAKMLNLNKKESGELITNFWNAMPALKELKEKVEAFWETTGKKYIIGLDNRKIFTRSKHSLLNSLFQSAGVICTKYTNIYMFDEFEKMGYCINPFKGRPDICEIIAYHDRFCRE